MRVQGPVVPVCRPGISDSSDKAFDCLWALVCYRLSRPKRSNASLIDLQGEITETLGLQLRANISSQLKCAKERGRSVRE